MGAARSGRTTQYWVGRVMISQSRTVGGAWGRHTRLELSDSVPVCCLTRPLHPSLRFLPTSVTDVGSNWLTYAGYPISHILSLRCSRSVVSLASGLRSLTRFTAHSYTPQLIAQDAAAYAASGRGGRCTMHSLHALFQDPSTSPEGHRRAPSASRLPPAQAPHPPSAVKNIRI